MTTRTYHKARLRAFLILGLGLARLARAATYGSDLQHFVDSNPGGTGALSHSFTVAAASNQYLIVRLVCEGAPTWTVTYNSQALTRIRGDAGPLNDYFSEIFVLPNPPAGNFTLSYSSNPGLFTGQVSAMVFTYSGVSALGANNGAVSTPPSGLSWSGSCTLTASAGSTLLTLPAVRVGGVAPTGYSSSPATALFNANYTGNAQLGVGFSEGIPSAAGLTSSAITFSGASSSAAAMIVQCLELLGFTTPTSTATPSPTPSPSATLTPMGCGVGKSVALLVGDPSLASSVGDQAISARLSQWLGYYVVVVDDDAADEVATAGAVDWFLISSTVASGNLNAASLRQVAKPVWTNEDNIMDELQLTGPMDEYHYGSSGIDDNKIDIINPASPLAGGLSGSGVPVFNSIHPIRWGLVPGAQRIVATYQSTSRTAVYAYAPGAAMWNGYAAPAKRLGFFLDDDAAQDFTPNGWALFDAAAAWMNCGSNATATATPPPSTPTPIAVGTLQADNFNDSSVAGFWTRRDIAAASVGSEAETTSLSVQAGGCDIWNNNDQFRFLSQRHTGSFDVSLRVDGSPGTDAWAKTGLMLRAGDADNAAFAFMMVTNTQGYGFQSRTSTAAGAVTGYDGPDFAFSGPRYLRLRRQGGLIYGYESNDGSTWTQVALQVDVYPDPILVGIAVTAHDCYALGTAVVDDFAVLIPPTNTPVFTATPTVVGASAAYLEAFGNGSGASLPLSSAGWKAYRGAAATFDNGTAGVALVSVSGGSPQDEAPINSSPAYPAEQALGLMTDQGSSVGQGIVLFYTDEAVISRSSAMASSITWTQGNKHFADTLRPAVQIAGQWFVSEATFTNPGVPAASDFAAMAQRQNLDFASAQWRSLSLVAGVSLSVTALAALPAGDITAFGLLAENSSSNIRFDNFAIMAASFTATPSVTPSASPTVTTCSQAQHLSSTASLTIFTSSNTFTHAVAAGSDRYLLVRVMLTGGPTVASVSYGGSPLSLIRRDQQSSMSAYLESWGMVNPPVGSASVVITASSPALGIIGAASSFSGISSGLPVGDSSYFQGNAAAVNATVNAGVTLGLVNAGIMHGNSSLTLGGGQSSRWNMNTGINNFNSDTKLSSSTGQQTLSYTFGGSVAYGVQLLELRPVQCGPTPTHTPTATPSVTPSTSPTSSSSATRTVTPSVTPSTSPTSSSSATRTVTPSVTPSISPTSSSSATLTATPSVTPSISPTSSSSATQTATPSVTPSISPTSSSSNTRTVTPSVTPSISPTSSSSASQTATPSVTPSISPTSSSSATRTLTPSATPTSTSTSSGTPSASVTPSASPAWTFSATLSVTPSASPTSTSTASHTSSPSATPSVSQTSSSTQTRSATLTASSTATSTGSPTATLSATPSASPTQTLFVSATVSPTPGAATFALKVYDSLGRLVYAKSGSAGQLLDEFTLSSQPWDAGKQPLLLSAPGFSASWDGHDDFGAELPSGVYLLVLETRSPAGSSSAQKSVALLRMSSDTLALSVASNPVPKGASYVDIYVSAPGAVWAEVHNVAGERIVSLGQPSNGILRWQLGPSLGSGIYFVSVRLEGQRLPKVVKIVLIR